jgi:hypothetical protein
MLLAALLWALPTLSVYADPIRITSGSLDIPDPLVVGGPRGILDIQGFDGFHLMVIGDAHNGLGHDCLPCQPGDSLSLAGSLQFGLFEVEGGPTPPNPPWQTGLEFAELSI